MTLWSINPNFFGLCSSNGQVAYALLTRAPVVAYPKVSLPLDLHVLSLPLAFILSQDQTLRCNCLSFLRTYQVSNKKIDVFLTCLVLFSSIIQRTLFVFGTAKIRIKNLPLQAFLNIFFKIFIGSNSRFSVFKRTFVFQKRMQRQRHIFNFQK